MAGRYRVERVRETPTGWKVRTVTSGAHRVRVAFPPGRRESGSGIVVEILHPRQENPCKNPAAELILMGINPMKKSSPYDSLSRSEKLAFGRLGLGKKHLQSKSDIERARTQVASVNRFRNRLPNPAGGVVGSVDSQESAAARDLAADFKHAASDRYFIANEPHVPTGNYSQLGQFVAIGVKPDRGGQVQEISFPEGTAETLILISDAGGRQLYIIGRNQELTDDEIAIFTDSTAIRVLLGTGRSIVYRATKWHPQVETPYRGKSLTYEHKFGEEGGRKPDVWYDRSMKRLLIVGGDYTVEDVGIKN